MSLSEKIAIVAALEREVRPLVKHWRVSKREHQGRELKFFENDRAVLVCGGVGAEPARRATEAIIALCHPTLVQSVGFAGALDPSLKIGAIVEPQRVIDGSDGSSVETGGGGGVLVSFVSVAGGEQKLKLAKAFGAQMVDMEAAAVARGAQARGIRFMAVKAISDECDFVMPPIAQFIGPDGQLQTARLLGFTVVRPWLWLKMIRLARNANCATRALCNRLEQYNRPAGKNESLGLDPVASQER